jgi:hypothetical protein
MEINKSKCKFKASLFNIKIASKYKIIKKNKDGSIKKFVSGQSDIWGLRGVKGDNKISIYPRMFNHEGASLDNAKFQNINIVCPWHNKKIKPIHCQEINNKEVFFNHLQKKYKLKITTNNIKINFM